MKIGSFCFKMVWCMSMDPDSEIMTYRYNNSVVITHNGNIINEQSMGAII